MSSRFVGRARLLSGLFIVSALLLIVRLYFIQIVHGEEYQRQAMGQYSEAVPDTGTRSTIFFTTRDGEHIAAAVMQTGWRLAIQPKDIKDPEQVFRDINTLLPLDRERFFAATAKTNDPYEEIAFRVSDEIAASVRALEIPGVILVQDQWRYYPGGELAAHTVGFVGYQGNTKTGVYGLERYWQNTLAETASGVFVNPFAEIFTNVKSALTTDPTAEEGSIITSIEPSVQAQLESTLDQVMETYTPLRAGGIVMDPTSGEIVAMSVHPTYDLNSYNLVKDPATYSNPLVENVFELGSIMKPLTMAAGIDVGAVSATTTYYDAGCIEKSGKRICNYDGKARERVSMQEVLNQSLNTGVSFVVDKMGHKIFGEYVHAYGLGSKTNIDLPSEATGKIGVVDSGYDIDFSSASFGQGIAVSPIAMIRALASLANGGVLPTPHIVKAIEFDTGLERSVTPQTGPRVLREETAEKITKMLIKVFDEALLKGELKQEHYSIAAKTGTAQIAIPGGGGYYKDRFLHSFFGYFPAHEPRFIVFLFAIEPHGAEFASATLARPFLDVAKYLINYYSIPPDR